MTIAWAILSTVLISLASLVGIFATLAKKSWRQRIVRSLVSFSVGALLGDAFVHLIPEALEKIGSSVQTAIWILTGFLSFFLLERLVRWQHCHDAECLEHRKTVLSTVNLVGDGLHNLVDGIMIGLSYMVSPTLGLASSLAILFHEVPQEIGDFGVLLYSGLSVKKALFLNLASASLAILGTLGALLFFGPESSLVWPMLALAAGGFIYIGATDLVPELHQHQKNDSLLKQLLFIILGIGVMILLTRLE